MCKFEDHADEYGHLTSVEGSRDVPFEVKRVYYITGVQQGVRRGFHAHSRLEQVLICLNGSVTIQLNTPAGQQDIVLDSPTKGLYLGPYIWREMYDFSPGAVLMVLASEYYEPEEYIRDYTVFLQQAKEYMEKEGLCQ